MSKQPLIIIGAHRSGTSLLTRILESLGVFIGSQLESNHESLFFFEINEWIFHQCGSSWDNPHSLNIFFEDKENLMFTKNYINDLINTPRLIKYLGLRKYLRYRSLSNLDFDWGWKDPRNTFTLPFWLLFFPDAKIIHISRHGLDVAQSLYTRNKKEFRKYQDSYKFRKYALPFYPENGRFNNSIFCSSLDKAFYIWEQYISEATRFSSMVNCYSIKYENLLSKPRTELEDLISFLEIDIDSKKETQINEISASLVTSRANAFEKNVELLTLEEKYSLILNKYGY